MATYKVIQDIEAEDKFIGPLTLKQFVFAAGGAFFGYLNVFALTKGATWALAIFIPPMLLGFFLAIPWSSHQPTDVWLLAKLRFYFKPKRRVWNQDGLVNLVTITAPKKVEKKLTNDLSEKEVTSRLKALAATIDTRGWAVKNADLPPVIAADLESDRLVSPAILPKQVPEIDSTAVIDPLDDNTPVSAHFQNMIQTSSEIRKEQTLEKMQKIRQGVPLEQINQPEIRFTPPPQPIGTPPLDEQLLARDLEERKKKGRIAYGHMHAVPASPGPISAQPQTDGASAQDDQQAPPVQSAPTAQGDQQKAQAAMTTPSTPAILDLAHNDDLNIETIARQANKASQGNDEVVISLR